MTNYQKMLFNRVVKKSLREKLAKSKDKAKLVKQTELPKYITDNPFYP